MADFYQHTQLPTLHHLAAPDPVARGLELVELAVDRPVAVLLPALFVETQRPALPAILGTLADAPYVSEIVLTMNVMSAAESEEAVRLCRQWAEGKTVRILWNDGPALQVAHHRLAELGWDGGCSGKGANIWMGLAYLQAAGRVRTVICHDTDILNYDASVPARLCYPVVHPRMGYRFAKGYYSRVRDRLFGRVTRLLVFPLIRAFQDVLGAQPLLQHLESFRYPLSGEFAGDLESLAGFSLPSAWGLEVAMLGEAHRRLPFETLCQVDLGFHYEHRHRQLLTPGIEHGLVAAAADVARCLAWQILRDLPEAERAAPLREALRVYRERRAPEWLERYEHVALLNGLVFDRAEEEHALQTFAAALDALHADVDRAGLHMPGMRPPPAQALAELPGFAEQIQEAAM
jgi:glucosyl-3-phosphoglycerate synthase